MPSDYDATEFVDHDVETAKRAYSGTGASASSTPATPAASVYRAPSRDELDSKVAEAQQKLAELKREQENLERERAALEETRRRQAEFQTGRQEMLQHLTRGIGLLEESEFAARQEAEQMARTLAEFKDAISKVESINESDWTKDNFPTELTRALTILENARMEWNSARLKFPLLSGVVAEGNEAKEEPARDENILSARSFGELCRIGFALTWPLALVGSAGIAVLIVLLLRH